jgi:thiamine kinase-like enzyme
VLAEVEDLLDQEARVGLLAAIVRHGDWRAQVADRVVCHGDVHPGNIIQTSEGPVLLDWDLSCLAPAAWDHAMLLTWASVWGGELGAYERFAEGYGRSLAQDPLAESLAVMRNVTATLMRLKAGRTNPAAADEAQRRLRHWRGDPAAPIWSAQ